MENLRCTGENTPDRKNKKHRDDNTYGGFRKRGVLFERGGKSGKVWEEVRFRMLENILSFSCRIKICP